MPGGRRGLVAPQNTFLDVLIKRAVGQADVSFVLANAQIVDYPIVYCSEEFSKLLGFKRSEVMHQSLRCDFMIGTLTDNPTIERMIQALSTNQGGVYEILYYKKNGHGIWLQQEVAAIRSEEDNVVLFLCIFRDITAFREPLEGGMMSNLSKFARLAWTMTKSRQQAAAMAGGQEQSSNSVGASPGPGAAAAAAAAAAVKGNLGEDGPDGPTTDTHVGKRNNNLVRTGPSGVHHPPSTAAAASGTVANSRIWAGVDGLRRPQQPPEGLGRHLHHHHRPALTTTTTATTTTSNGKSNSISAIVAMPPEPPLLGVHPEGGGPSGGGGGGTSGEGSSGEGSPPWWHRWLFLDWCWGCWLVVAGQDAAGKKMQGRRSFMDSLPEYRHEPPKTPPHILLHYSAFKVAWDWLILLLTFYSVVMVPYNLAVNRTFNQDDVSLVVVDSVVDIIFFVDIIFNFHTSFVGHDGEVIVDEAKIRRNYLRSGFLIDIMACLPYDILNIFDDSGDRVATSLGARDGVGGPDGGSGGGYANIFSILKVMRLFRLGRVARALHRFLESSFALLLLMLSFYVIVAHWFACIWYAIGREDLKVGIQHGWLTALANKTGSPFVLVVEPLPGGGGNETRILGGPSVTSMYLTALYFTMTCMTSIGFGNVAAETDSEKAFSCCMMIISSLLYAAIFGHVTTIIHNMTLATAKYHEMLNSVKEFMVLNEVPRTLCERVLDYVVSKWANTKGVDQERVLSVCPKDMRADICVHLNRRVFNSCPAFRLASDGCLRALAVGFEMIHSAPGDFVFRKGESIKELCFVATGSLEVIQDGEILALLGQGDVFGDAQWKENKVAKSAVHIRALTYCDIHMINVEKLREVLEFYKAFAQTFSRNLTLTYDLSKRTIFYKVADKRLEKSLGAAHQFEPPFTPAQIQLLKRAVQKFRANKLMAGSGSTDVPFRASDPVPKAYSEMAGGSSERRGSLGSPVLRDRLISRLNAARQGHQNTGRNGGHDLGTDHYSRSSSSITSVTSPSPIQNNTGIMNTVMTTSLLTVPPDRVGLPGVEDPQLPHQMPGSFPGQHQQQQQHHQQHLLKARSPRSAGTNPQRTSPFLRRPVSTSKSQQQQYLSVATLDILQGPSFANTPHESTSYNTLPMGGHGQSLAAPDPSETYLLDGHKAEISESLRQLDHKISRLEAMISTIFLHLPAATSPARHGDVPAGTGQPTGALQLEGGTSTEGDEVG